MRESILSRQFLTLIFAVVICIPSAQADDFFERRVRPLLVERCFSCHSGTKTSGGLSLDSRAGWKKGGDSGPAIVPGNPAESLLVDAIKYGSLEMPPPGKGKRLSAEEVAVLEHWIARGAVDPRDEHATLGGMTQQQAADWWAFQPLPDVSATLNDKGIDEFLTDAQREQSLTPVAATDKRTLIRRASYDLTGLPPTPEEVQAFIDDDSPQAFERVVDRLLSSPQYGVRWGRHWLDVVRYADTAGENSDRPLPHAWRYRNWVFDSFNRDLPFDEFARLQLCGDILRKTASESERNEGVVATGYLAVARRFGHDIDHNLHLMHEDVIDNLGKSFLGLTLACARCHDHKYDPVTSEDYYALYGIFNSTLFSFPGCEPRGQPNHLVPLMDQAKADSLMADYRKRLDEYEKRAGIAPQTTARLKEIASKNFHVLSKATVGEGKTVSLNAADDGALDRIAVREGEVLQLAVLPNGSHGADSTRVELEISRVDQPEATWSVDELIDRLTDDGPMVEHNGATWCFTDVTEGPVFLHEKATNIDGQPSLSAWRIGGTPSVFVNSSEQPVSVWTTLPPRSFFVHPGVGRTVAVAWICPSDGEYQVRGSVADAHPAGGDGVAFRFEHVASSEFGDGLVKLGEHVSKAKPEKPQPPKLPVAYAVIEREGKNAQLQRQGDPEQLGDEVQRRWLSVFGGEAVPNGQGSGREQLANHLVESPLFARVIVNRVWQWHFGRGMVASPNDFGSRGQPPTHPELLDWLAAQFKANGYKIKPLHRLIMNSAAYRRTTSADNSLIEADPDNRYLARFSRRRLSAEEIRDSLLVVSCSIDLSQGTTHPFPSEETWKFTQHDPFTAVYETNRRSAYLMVQRQRRHPFLALFDGADPNSSTAGRQTTTVPTQALYFLNDPFFHERASQFADCVLRDTENEGTRISGMFQTLFQRQPTDGERRVAVQFLKQYPEESDESWQAYARVLLASNEFLYLD